MAVGGGVRVTSSSSVEVWGRRTGAPRRGPATVRCSCVGEAGAGAAGGLAEDHYRTLRLRPGATRGEVKKAFRRLALTYHPDVCKESDGDSGVHFQRINVAYQMLMSNMREAEDRLEYWRLRYGLTDEDLDKYRYYLNDQDDDWFDM
ncbi:chaperone protein dnaJ 8, chloroplastic-like [Phragmites australis]|uniref:chaperone protein dnaJ 8, chloroplastic-like n=1 Tax=Phragmites australis TaxID=29695 RepID=UPI002D78E308|nr:chaperone protein dnaJ 8, chloroplastic-like [Phragmites australis]